MLRIYLVEVRFGGAWAKTVLYVMVSSVVNAMSMYSKYVLGLAVTVPLLPIPLICIRNTF